MTENDVQLCLDQIAGPDSKKKKDKLPKMFAKTVVRVFVKTIKYGSVKNVFEKRTF